MLSFKNKNHKDIDTALNAAGITIFVNDGAISSTDNALAQAIIDALPEPMPDLEPRQFKLMVASVGLVPLIKAVLDLIALSTTDQAREMFKSAYSQYEGGTVYFWDKSLFEWQRLSPMFEALYTEVYGENAPPFTLNEDDLREAWILASQS